MHRTKKWLATGSIMAALAIGAALPAFAQTTDEPTTEAPAAEESEESTEDSTARKPCDRDQEAAATAAT